MKPPKYLRKYFWNVYFEKLDSKKNYYTIIERILEYGDEKAIKWMFKTYPKDQIKEIVKTSRAFTFLKNDYFWAWYFNLKEQETKCLQKDYLRQHRAIWPY
ncbi:MAG: hypothetical protein M1501_01080 [Candidatus Omnitrophica bacterium]|nr:hypothetical protein [Candidatus Omnitrophota bacterium]